MINYGMESRIHRYSRLLRILNEGSMTEAELIEALYCNPYNLRHNLLDVQSLGYVVKNENVYSLTEEGRNYIEIINNDPRFYRMHRNSMYGRGRFGAGFGPRRGGNGHFRGY